MTSHTTGNAKLPQRIPAARRMMLLTGELMLWGMSLSGAYGKAAIEY